MTNTFKQHLVRIFKHNRSDLILIVLLMIIAAFVQASSVLGLMPLVDFVVSNDLSKANQVTKFVVLLISRINLPVNIITMGGFYLIFVLTIYS